MSIFRGLFNYLSSFSIFSRKSRKGKDKVLEGLFLEDLRELNLEALERLQEQEDWEVVLEHLRHLIKARLHEAISSNPSRERDVLAAEIRVLKDLYQYFKPDKGDLNDDRTDGATIIR